MRHDFDETFGVGTAEWIERLQVEAIEAAQSRQAEYDNDPEPEPNQEPEYLEDDEDERDDEDQDGDDGREPTDEELTRQWFQKHAAGWGWR